MAFLVRLFLAFALASATTAFAQSPEASAGEERILRFTSDVHVQRDGDLDVTETIRVVALGQEIKRGIQRDFPTRYASALGQRSHTSFKVVSVERDGQTEPYELISLGNGTRVRIGRADVFLPHGEHSYAIRYRTGRQIAYGSKSDELYWNATGTGWTFPIDLAEARITLPSAARFGDRAVYTGAQGSTAHDAAVVSEQSGAILFRTTQPLPRENGLTVAVAFPKGVLDAPSSGRRLHWWLSDWGALAAGIAALLLLIGYYVRAWWLVGRGPRAGTVVPLFTPPDGMSAAATRYVWNMKLDNRGFTAAIVDLAVAGHIHIRKEDDGWLTRGTTTLEKVSGGKAIAAPEAATVEVLFADADSIDLRQANHSDLQAARTALNTGLEAAYASRMFEKHRDWATFGMLLIALAIIGAALLSALFRWPDVYPAEIKAAVFATGLFALAWVLHRLQRRGGSTSSWVLKLGSWAAAIGGALFGFGAVVGALQAGAWPVLLPLLAIPVALSAYNWLYAPTAEGRAVMDRIAGFRQYLGITEEARLETLHPPEKTPELFERYLPYAIALDVENHWAERFADVLATAAAAGTAAHSLGWYSGSGDFWNDPGGFAGSVGSSLASTISSASQSPSSSGGGSSGGGSSGGGGGGGGGSGW